LILDNLDTPTAVHPGAAHAHPPFTLDPLPAARGPDAGAAGDLFLHRAMRVDNLDALRRWMPHYVKVHGVLAGLLTLAMCAPSAWACPSG
jgi:hypothetical protein